MYSIVKILIVIKLTLILLIVTAGIGIVPDSQVSRKNSHHDSYHSMESSFFTETTMDRNSTVPLNQSDRSETLFQIAGEKSSLSDLRLFIEL